MEPKMEMRELRYFVEVVRRGGFTRASDSLHVTQPAISNMVKALEEEIGFPLLVRERRRVSLTDAGRIVFERAEGLLDSVRRMEEEVAELSTLRRGRVRIGLPPMVGMAFFPGVLAEFHRAYPEVVLELRERGARRIEALVLERELDVGATVLPTDEVSFGTLPFVKDVVRAVLPRGHALARKRELQLRELENTPFLLHRPEFAVHEHVLEACRKVGFTPDIVSESSQWDFLVAMVVAGLGVALLPETICAQLDRRQVTTLPVKPTIPWDLALIWRRDRYLSPATRAWLDLASRRLLKQAFAEAAAAVGGSRARGGGGI
jgi:DNA-binding transcriptional LysR family regulator